jgi:hypothetical protein
VKNSSLIKYLIIVLLIQMGPLVLIGQDTIPPKRFPAFDKKFLLEIPLWLPGIRGQLSVGDIDLEPASPAEDKEFKRINRNTVVEFYLVGRGMYKSPKVMAMIDAFSGKIGRTYAFKPLIGGAERELVYLTVQLTFPRLILGYTAWNLQNEKGFNLDLVPYFGARYMKIHLKTDVFGNENVIDLKPSWYELLFGLYIPIDYKRLKFEFQFDYGISNSVHSWTINNDIRYRISRLLDFQVGWTLMKVRHNSKIDNQDFNLSMDLFGPTMGIGLWF